MNAIVKASRTWWSEALSWLAALGIALVLMSAGVSTAGAQPVLPLGLAVMGGAVDYDLSGTGVAPGFAVRATRPLSSHVDLDLGGLLVNPSQQFGRSTLLIPEAHLKYRWTVGAVSPFVGGGGGAAFDSGGRNGWDARPALSFSVGAHVRLNRQLGVIGELRGRGIGRSFSASTADWLGGLTWSFE